MGIGTSCRDIQEEERMADAVIVAAGRTPIGRAKKGSLVDVRPDDMLGFVIAKVVEQSGVEPSSIVDVIAGCGMPHGEQGMNVARVAGLLAGLPETVAGTTVNRFCSSSLQAIRMAYHAIKAGEGDTFVACGVESISRIEQLSGGFEALNPKFLGEDAVWQVYLPMGLTAENVADRYDVPRDKMDEFAQQSQERAVAAQKNGFFDREIIPYPKPDGTTVDRDDGPRPDSTLEKLKELKPAFKEDGRVTAGNSCPLNDGAAATVVMNEDRARAEGIKPLVRIKASAVSALDPAIMGVGPIDACRRVLAQAGMTIDDIDVMELNEAFAAQVIPVCAELGVDPFSDKLNPHGGAIALGHPYGMTGARIMSTLINDLNTMDRTIGLETMCVGGGQGMAMIVERVD
jgi:acetyl-CoA C-acetyltransferase